MYRIVIVILMYHRHKLFYLIQSFFFSFRVLSMLSQHIRSMTSGQRYTLVTMPSSQIEVTVGPQERSRSSRPV
jgi:hypothetical protein